IGQTFTLTFTHADITGAVVSDTTAPILYLGINTQTAINIRNALLPLSNSGGIGGDVQTLPDPLAGVIHITFIGSLSDLGLAVMVPNPGPPFVVVSINTEGVPATVIDGTSGFPGVWR